MGQNLGDKSVHSIAFSDVLMTIPYIYDEAFLENSLRLKSVNCFREKVLPLMFDPPLLSQFWLVWKICKREFEYILLM